MSVVFENVGFNILSVVIIKTIEIGWRIIQDPESAFREHEKIRIRLKAQIRGWEAINTHFHNASIQSTISKSDFALYGDIITELLHLLREYVKRKCKDPKEREKLLAETDMTGKIQELEGTPMLNLTEEEKKEQTRGWLRFRSQVKYGIWDKTRDRDLIAEIEQWGRILDEFSSHVLPAIVTGSKYKTLFNESLPHTDFTAQVQLARFSSAVEPDISVLSRQEQTDFSINGSRVEFAPGPLEFTPPPSRARTPRPGTSPQDLLKHELERRSELGGQDRRRWIKFQQSDTAWTKAILEFKPAPMPSEPKLDPTSLGDWNITQENAKVIKMLRVASRDPTKYRILYCEGVYSQPDYFGFIYRVPMVPAHWRNPRCESLGNILLNGRHIDNLGLNLENRLKMAKALAWAVLELHLVDFVHESIHPDNILVFGEFHGNAIHFAWSDPYLVGFHCSREVEGASTKLRNNPTHWTARLYTHPDRQMPAFKRFERVYDIYSLGVVLLELGLMTSFMESGNLAMFCSEGWDPPKYRNYFIQKARGLERILGTTYMEVVLTCLDGTFQDDGYLLMTQFRNKVCEKLDRIKLS